MDIKKCYSLSLFIIIGLLTFGCSNEDSSDKKQLTWDTEQDSSDIIIQIDEELNGPESVVYYPQDDSYFISNFNGDGKEEDSNGYITKASHDGEIINAKFATGTEEHPLHAPRGLYIANFTLWAVDINGVHGFDVKTGEQISYVDFSQFDPGFLNDISTGPGGQLYITDSEKSRLYTIKGEEPSIVHESLPSPPNGITLNPKSNELVLAPWSGYVTFLTWKPGQKSPRYSITVDGGNFDGIEYIDDRLLIASQRDKSIHVAYEGKEQKLIKTPGLPADIGVNTKRKHLAVPYIAKNRVDIWQLPTPRQ